MRICFLDFDGVLNSYEFMQKESELHGTPDGPRGTVGLDPLAVARVNKICELGNASIVISSSWRYGHKLIELKEILANVGLTVKVLDTTPLPRDLLIDRLRKTFEEKGLSAPPDTFNRIIEAHGRGVEIDHWLRQNALVREIDGFVVLDDDSDIEPHMNRHIKTSFALGLQDEHIPRAVEILNRKWHLNGGKEK